ncbi:MAG TPA: cobalamin-independent methionine synthase II family protein [Chloroflexota bacterium]
MKRSKDRILTTHAGALEQPEALRSRTEGWPRQLEMAVAEVVRKQVECGLDVVNDGELGKQNFYRYVADRISGLEMRQPGPSQGPPWAAVARDAGHFRAYYDRRGSTLFGRGAEIHSEVLCCTGPLEYTGRPELEAEILNLRAALGGLRCEEAFLPAPGPSTLSRTIRNEHYTRDEDFVFALADTMREEYRTIVEAGFLLQIDDPHLAMAWQSLPDVTVREYQALTEVQVEALNHALRGIPAERVRLHTCWGSWVGPHTGDIPLRDIIGLLLKVNAAGLSLEASNPRHEHEWQVFEEVKLPDGKVLIPGVLCHVTDFVEAPELVAQRLVRYARLVGRENVIAGTDCGLRRVGHPDIAWAKFRAMVEGARLASAQLWA